MQYCVDVVDSGMEQKRAEFDMDDTVSNGQLRRRRDAVLYAEEVKVC